MRDLTMQDLTLTDQIAGVKMQDLSIADQITGPDNEGPVYDAMEISSFAVIRKSRGNLYARNDAQSPRTNKLDQLLAYVIGQWINKRSIGPDPFEFP